MARARFIRPEFFTDEKIGELPFGARLLFAGIWCHTDLRGVFEHSPRQLRVLIFPHDEGLTSKQIEEWLGLLKAAKFICCFEAQGKLWGHVCKWLKYQSISGREVDIDAKLSPEKRRPSCPGCAQAVPKQCPGSAHAPSPSISPALSPAPAGEGDETPPTPPPGMNRISIGKPEEVREALTIGFLPALLASFGIDPGLDIAKWIGAADGLQMASVGAILWWRWKEDDRIQYVSGFKKARALWKALKPAEMKEIGELFYEHIQLPLPA